MNSFFGQNVNNLDLMLCIMESGVVNMLLKKRKDLYFVKPYGAFAICEA